MAGSLARAALIAAAAVLPVALVARTDAPQAAYVPERVYDTAAGAFVDFEVMLADLARADVAFVGEQHDDPNTHRLERAVLEGLARRRGNVLLSLEMFERDVQAALDRFLAGEVDEAAFLAGARPWPRYATDYKPLVDFASAHGWPVIAANVPRPVATEVAKTGAGALDGRPDAERGWFAAERICPADDEYFRRFRDAMGAHPADDGSSSVPAEQVERYYLSQCLKDETMAESIARALATDPGGDPAPLVVHVNGAFHSDFRLGTASRVERRLPGRRAVVVTILPVDDLDLLAPSDDDRRRADYLVYTIGR
jgi:uncharacterized iron-regulated protein